MSSLFTSGGSKSRALLCQQMRRCAAIAWMAGTLCAGHAWAQTDYLTFTGVWSNVPITGLSAPSAITGDANGNIYITDTTVSSVIKIAADGTQTSIGANLNSPEGIGIDTSGNLYVSSNGDSKVYKITAGGTQTSLGSGWNSPVSVAVDSNGNVFVTDSNGLSEVTSGGSQSVLQSSESIRGVAIDSNNNIYYGDNTNHEVYEIPANTNSPSSLNYAAFVQNLYVDTQGNVFVAGTGAGVRRSDDSYGDYTVFGDATVSYGVWGDGHSNLYIADAAGNVEKLALGPVDFGSVNVCPAGATVTPCSATETLHFAMDSVVNATPSTRALTLGQQNLDYSITSDSCSGNLIDGATCAMTLSFAPEAAGLRVGAAQAIGSSTIDDFAPPVGLHPHVSTPVRPRDEPAGTLLTSVLLHGIGIAPVGTFSPAPIITDEYTLTEGGYLGGLMRANGDLYITDSENCIVQKYSNSTTTLIAGTTCGTPSGDGGLATSAILSEPTRTVMDGAGNLYIAGFECTVRKVDGLTGIISTVAGTGECGNSGDGGLATSASLHEPLALALDPKGNLFIADQDSNVVRRVDAVTGIITTVAGNGTGGYSGDNGPATSAELDWPDALALDSNGNLYIADDMNNVIRKVDPSGNITTFAGTGTAGYAGDGGLATSAQINDPEGLGTDPAGNVYIADASNYLVREVNAASGIITTVAGAYTGSEAYSGDNGPSTLAGLSYVQDVAVDTQGNIFIADADNNVIRIVIAPVGMAAFGSETVGSTSAAQDVALSNVGTSPLSLTALQAPADFTVGGADTTCNTSTTLAVASTCVLGFEFVPTATGSLSETFTITDNNGNAVAGSQAVSLSGTGTAVVAAKLAFAADPPSIAAGGNLGTIAVVIEDANSNVVTGATSQVTLTITGPGGYSHTVTVAAVNGVASFNLSGLAFDTAGTYTLTATSTGLTQAQATATVTSNNEDAPAKLAFGGTINSPVAAGSNLGAVPVDVENASGTVLLDATNTVTLTVTGPGGYSYSVTVTATSGVASFNLGSLALTTPGTYTLTATSNGLTQAVATVTVTAGDPTAPVQLSIPSSSVPATIASGGNPGVVKVDINNSSGEVVTSATNTVTLTITGPGGYSYVLTSVAVDGVASFDFTSLSLTAPGTYTLTATSGHLTQALATFVVSVDFTIAVSTGTPSSAGPIAPGTSTVFSFTLAPASGSFNSPINITATGLPADATSSFSATTVTPASGDALTKLTIQTARSTSARLMRRHDLPWTTGLGALALGMLILPLSASQRMRKAFRKAPLLPALLLVLAFGATAGLTGCGAGGLFGQPQQTYTITVTGTSGSISHSATVTLTVQ